LNFFYIARLVTTATSTPPAQPTNLLGKEANMSMTYSILGQSKQVEKPRKRLRPNEEERWIYYPHIPESAQDLEINRSFAIHSGRGRLIESDFSQSLSEMAPLT
jgi:hypothetical protein